MVSEEQIKQWKSEHGNVFAIEIDGAVSFLKQPDRKVISLAIAKGRKNSLEYIDTVVNNCHIGGAKINLDNPGVVLGISEQIDQIVEIATVKVKKL